MYKEPNIENKSALLKNYSRYTVEFERGEGAYLYDTSGKKYLDFLCGIAVTSFGHNHPMIKSTLIDQINKLWHVSNLFSSSGQEELAKELSERSGLDYVFFCNSGTEANEAAIKFARKTSGSGKTHIIAALNGFHGRTMGSLSASGQEKLWNGFYPLSPGFSFVKYGDIEELQLEYVKYKNQTAAVLLEPIQGESGIIIPEEGYLKAVREFCDEHNILMIVDEVQSGIGRTGKFFAHQWENIIPDIITVAKGIANGLPLGAAICSQKVAGAINPGDHGSTFGGNPVAVSAANTVMKLLDKDLLEKILIMGRMLVKSIEGLHTSKIKAIRGKGLMIGIEFNEGYSAKKIAAEMLKNGVVVGTSGDSVLRVLPPYIINQNDIVQFAVTLDNVLSYV